MSRFAFAVAAVVGGLALAGSAEAAGVVTAPAPMALSGVYVSVFTGYALGSTLTGNGSSSSTASIPLVAGYIVGGTVGTNLMPNLRGDLEFSYSSHGVGNATVTGVPGTIPTTGSVGTAYVMGDVWYDFDTGTQITPYVGGGLGFADVMPNFNVGGTNAFNQSSFALAAQVGFGAKFKVADNVSVDLGYRLKDVVNASLTSATAVKLTGVGYLDQSVQAGVEFGF